MNQTSLSSGVVERARALSRESKFVEGAALEQYLGRFAYCESVMSERFSPAMPPWSRAIVLAFLTARTLDEDNSHSGAGMAPWSEHGLRPTLLWFVDVCRTAVVAHVAPAVVTKIDIWVRRKRLDHAAIMAVQDAESFLRYNVAALLRVYDSLFLSRARSPVSEAEADAVIGSVTRTMDVAMSLMNELPAAALCDYVWKAVAPMVTNSASSPSQSPSPPSSHSSPDIGGCPCQPNPARQFVCAHLTFQELMLENDRLGCLKKDPFLASSFEALMAAFTKSCQVAFPTTGATREYQVASMRVFPAWSKTFTLLHWSLNAQQPRSVMLLKNERLLKRMAARLTAPQFSSLRDSLLKCAAEVSDRAPTDDRFGVTPFPMIDREVEMQASVLSEIASGI